MATFTWTFPRCGFTQTSGSPMAPTNCPRCSYPDEKGDAELEGEVGPEAALQQQEQEMTLADRARAVADSAEAIAQSIGPGDTAVVLDEGWLAECLEVVMLNYFDAKPPNWREVAAEVMDRYVGERPTLLCGCLAGVHGRGYDDMVGAHPDRRGT